MASTVQHAWKQARAAPRAPGRWANSPGGTSTQAGAVGLATPPAGHCCSSPCPRRDAPMRKGWESRVGAGGTVMEFSWLSSPSSGSPAGRQQQKGARGSASFQWRPRGECLLRGARLIGGPWRRWERRPQGVGRRGVDAHRCSCLPGRLRASPATPMWLPHLFPSAAALPSSTTHKILPLSGGSPTT